jgi:hypothetical protein
VHEVVLVVQVWPRSLVTVYPVMGEPSSDGAVQETAAEALPAVADTPVGASGTAIGVTLFEAADAAPVPSPLAAVTVKV